MSWTAPYFSFIFLYFTYFSMAFSSYSTLLDLEYKSARLGAP